MTTTHATLSYHEGLDDITVAAWFRTPDHQAEYVKLSGGYGDAVTFFADPADVAAMFRRFADEIDAAVAVQAVTA